MLATLVSIPARNFRRDPARKMKCCFLKTPRYYRDFIRAYISSSLQSSLANGCLFDLQAMGLFKLNLDMKQIIVNKSKLERENDRWKYKEM